MSRKQLNIRIDDEFEAAIEDIRRHSTPIPTVTEAVKAAVMAYRNMIVPAAKQKTRERAA